MYRVFLVEDEIIVREGIRDNFNWGNTNFLFAGEAPDGEVALPLLQEIKPDILITDIKMPFMDGIELSRIVKKNMPWIKVIILSGHDEFIYAKEAISAGVTEYLLKPISPDKLLSALNKVAELIETEKRERENVENMKKQLRGNLELFKDRFLSELAIGALSPAKAIDKAASLSLSLMAKYFLVMIVELESIPIEKDPFNYSEILKVEPLMLNLIENEPDILRFKRNILENVFIFKGENPEMIKDSAYRVAQSIKYEVERNSSLLVSVYIGSVNERIQGITQSLLHADKMRNANFIYGKFKIIGIDDIEEDASRKDPIIRFDQLSLFEFLKFGEKTKTEAFLDEYLKNIGASSLKTSIYIYYVYIDIVLAAAKFLDEIGGDNDILAPEIKDMENTVSRIASMEELKTGLIQVLEKVFICRNNIKKDKYSNVIEKAKLYIKDNYTDPDISLISVANCVSISPNHFSALFKQKVGQTFIDYLTSTRIKKAMELLKTTSFKISEIAYDVGYNDAHYFSYMFKKITGYTPKDYKGQ